MSRSESATRVKDFFARPQKWGSGDCFHFVHAVCCDVQDREIEIDWDKGYMGSTSELDLVRKLHVKKIDMHKYLVKAFLRPLGLKKRRKIKGVLKMVPGDVLVFRHKVESADGKVREYPTIGVVDDDWCPIEYNHHGINVCCDEVLEVWHHGT